MLMCLWKKVDLRYAIERFATRRFATVRLMQSVFTRKSLVELVETRIVGFSIRHSGNFESARNYPESLSHTFMRFQLPLE